MMLTPPAPPLPLLQEGFASLALNVSAANASPVDKRDFAKKHEELHGGPRPALLTLRLPPLPVCGPSGLGALPLAGLVSCAVCCASTAGCQLPAAVASCMASKYMLDMPHAHLPPCCCAAAALGSRIKYLVDTPEMIWGCLDSRQYLEGAKRFLRAR